MLVCLSGTYNFFALLRTLSKEWRWDNYHALYFIKRCGEIFGSLNFPRKYFAMHNNYETWWLDDILTFFAFIPIWCISIKKMYLLKNSYMFLNIAFYTLGMPLKSRIFPWLSDCDLKFDICDLYVLYFVSSSNNNNNNNNNSNNMKMKTRA